MYNFILPSLVAALGWGISPFFEKIIIENTDFQTVLVFKGLIYGIFGLIMFLMNAKHFLKIREKFAIIKEKKVPLIYLSVISVIFSYVIGNLAYLFAMGKNKHATMLVPLVAYVMPLIFMTIISYFITKENINIRMILGICITIFGIIFTLLNKD
jgi:drug/metabolite transporter (DMT)-like permease